MVDPRSTTPTISPPRDFIPLNDTNGNNATAAAPQAADTSQILKALADMAKTNTPATGAPSQANSNNVPNFQNAFTQNMPPSVNPASTVPPANQGVNVPGMANGANPFAGLMSSAPNFAQNMQNIPNGQPNMQANPVMPQPNTTPQALQQQVQLLQMLQAQGVPQEQWAPLLSALMIASGAGGAMPAAAAQPNWQQNGGFGRDDSSRDRNGYNDSYILRWPNCGYSDSSRSGSPGGYNRRRDPSPPRRRDSPVYGEFGRGRGDSRRQGQNGRGNDYRQRSPQDRYNRRSNSPHDHDQTLPPPGPKSISFDNSIPNGSIKGTRTLAYITQYCH